MATAQPERAEPDRLSPVRADALARPGGRANHPGLWRFASVIPVSADVGARLSMGEGATPVIAAGDAELSGVTLKLEFLSPTGSFKDRGAAVLVTAAVSHGARALVADSSGNAGSAIAAYAARAGLPCRVFVPAGTSPAKRAQIRAFGADIESVPGDRAATATAAQAAVRERAAVYASHVYDPAFFHGTKTFAYELYEQLGGAPDAVVVPAGNGTLLLGAALGFTELEQAGVIAHVPALIAVQSAACAPLAGAWAADGSQPRVVASAEPTLAEGIAIAQPPRGQEMLAAVRASAGAVVAVPEAAIRPAQADLARRGLLVEPTAAVPWAAVLMIRAVERVGVMPDGPGWSRARELVRGTVVVPLCGTGLKGDLGWVDST